MISAKTTVLLEALLGGKAKALTEKAITMAESGDPAMMRLCIERLIPPRKDRPINFELPPLKTTQDASLAMLKILEGVAKGELTPSEASEISKVIENYADTVRLTDLEERISEMKQNDETADASARSAIGKAGAGASTSAALRGEAVL